jgi:hypothetical protein
VTDDDRFAHLRPRPLHLAAIAVTDVLANGHFGVTTYAVNGRISPLYFITILRWHHVANVWRASIAQSAYEGLLFGVFFSLVFTNATGIITGTACHYGLAFKHLLGFLAGAYLSWVLGGLAGMILASISPKFYRSTFIGVSVECGPMLRYGWVDGSIRGVELGGLVSVIVGLVVLRANWRRAGRCDKQLGDSGWSGPNPSPQTNLLTRTPSASSGSRATTRRAHAQIFQVVDRAVELC